VGAADGLTWWRAARRHPVQGGGLACSGDGVAAFSAVARACVAAASSRAGHHDLDGSPEKGAAAACRSGGGGQAAARGSCGCRLGSGV
jgi:hypothetical protein